MHVEGKYEETVRQRFRNKETGVPFVSRLVDGKSLPFVYLVPREVGNGTAEKPEIEWSPNGSWGISFQLEQSEMIRPYECRRFAVGKKSAGVRGDFSMVAINF